MNEFSRDLLHGMREAAEIAKGKRTAARAHTVDVSKSPAPRGRTETRMNGTDHQPKGEFDE